MASVIVTSRGRLRSGLLYPAKFGRQALGRHDKHGGLVEQVADGGGRVRVRAAAVELEFVPSNLQAVKLAV